MTTVADPLVRLSGIEFSVVSGPERTTILHAIDLTLEAGTALSIVGPSGAGKTTLASIVGALQGATNGSYRFLGSEITGQSSRQLARFRSKHIGFVFQSSHLIDERSTQSNVLLGLTDYRLTTRDREMLSRTALERVGLEDIASRRAADLSGGERHRVALARALVKSPTLLIADEPTAALDQSTGQAILDLLADVTTSGTTLVLVSHDPRAATISDQVVTIIDGRLA